MACELYFLALLLLVDISQKLKNLINQTMIINLI